MLGAAEMHPRFPRARDHGRCVLPRSTPRRQRALWGQKWGPGSDGTRLWVFALMHRKENGATACLEAISRDAFALDLGWTVGWEADWIAQRSRS